MEAPSALSRMIPVPRRREQAHVDLAAPAAVVWRLIRHENLLRTRLLRLSFRAGSRWSRMARTSLACRRPRARARPLVHGRVGFAEPSLYRRCRTPGYVRDALERPLLNMLEQPWLPQMVRQMPQALERARQVSFELWTPRVVGGVLRRRGIGHAERSIGDALAQVPMGCSRRDGREPILEGLGVAQPMQIAMHHQKNVLYHVLYVAADADDPATDRGDVCSVLDKCARRTHASAATRAVRLHEVISRTCAEP